MVQRFLVFVLCVAFTHAGNLLPAPAPVFRAAPLPPFAPPPLVAAPAPLFRTAPPLAPAPLLAHPPAPFVAPAPLLRAAPLPPPVYAPAPLAPLPPPVLRAAPVLAPAPVVAKTIVDAEYDPNPQYSFGYTVDDALTGDSKAQIETRSGDVVQGSYSLTDSDGTRRIVDYAADPINGFNAVVRKEPLVAPAPVAFAAPHPPVIAKIH
ncbi:larval cuticle protein A3A-like [Agrilus planipennis]|uniref:Larval cuticle protein A3A-like n=1 Tax=Agrilus planipennis TaxID=224129 RepID=A0A1W4XEX7_AGRPL|nr:larval cuticle protein A3A-like [Agrilus planipennis]XP_025832156.1 larval cuticle protein A3A-like [Agrilus planipennis]